MTCSQHVTGPRHRHVRHTSALRLCALFANPKSIELQSLPNESSSLFPLRERAGSLVPIQKG